MDAEKVIKSSVELGLLNESDVPACSRFLAGAIGTDEIIEKLQIFKFGEHYRLLEKVENEDTKSFLSDYSEPCSSSIAERISSDTGTVKKYYGEQVPAGRRRPRNFPTFFPKIDVLGWSCHGPKNYRKLSSPSYYSLKTSSDVPKIFKDDLPRPDTCPVLRRPDGE